MRVLSLFDGMACGMLAFMEAGVEVERYDAYEIDKYAIQTATHNFPNIKEHGDVFTADFTEYKGVDFVIGGSPCTYWSIAQKNNRETEASGMGWELFQQYVRAIKEAEPKYFIYENNASMSKAIRESKDKAIGFTAVQINSALVASAIKNTPTVDAGEVVRCKDCVWYKEIEGYEYKGIKPKFCFRHACTKSENYYCADGWKDDDKDN